MSSTLNMCVCARVCVCPYVCIRMLFFRKRCNQCNRFTAKKESIIKFSPALSFFIARSHVRDRQVVAVTFLSSVCSFVCLCVTWRSVGLLLIRSKYVCDVWDILGMKKEKMNDENPYSLNFLSTTPHLHKLHYTNSQ